MIEEKALHDLDFFKILSIIEEFSNSEATRKTIRRIRPASTINEAQNLLKEWQEIREFLDEGGNIPLSAFPDLDELLLRAQKEGAFFEPWELTKFLVFLRVLERISPIIDKLLNFPNLSQKIQAILGNYLSLGQPYLLNILESTVDEEGNILDSASQMLKFLRKQIKITEVRIREKLEEIINRKEVAVFLQDRFITKRNERWVIPVRMDSKGQIRGKVHDVSRSGETAFIEPEEISSLSKKLEELKIEERLEEIRILREISDHIHTIASRLKREFDFLVYLDKLHAIYKFSNKFNAQIPTLTTDKHIKLINARHPILMLTKARVEPLNLELKDKRVLVITGPNAGGKTVSIMTVGILTCMALSGLPIPADASTIIPYFNKIYIDIHHEGSLEEHLSSFASHILAIKDIIEKADQDSLVILDEIGTNTDPEEGSALACAIIEELKNRGGFTFVTTHLSKVKIFAATSEGMQIAAMLFDEKNMTPLYRLSIGTITTSYALEVAKKYGFPESLIKRAYELKGTEDRRIYELMEELEKIKNQYASKIEDIERLRKELLAEKSRLDRELTAIQEKRKRAIEEAKEEAKKMLINLKKEINLLHEEARRADRQKLRELSLKATSRLRELQVEHNFQKEEVKIGDLVKIRNTKIIGKVISLEQDKIKIQTDNIQVSATMDEIEKIREAGKVEKDITSSIKILSTEEGESFSNRKLDIRGIRVDEALSMVEEYLNELSIKESQIGFILHGVGKGILRDAVREFLKSHPLVKSFRKGTADEGGEAVTVVEIR